VIGIMGEDRVDALLIFSQVILSLQLGFAVIPLIHFVSDKVTMGEYAIGWPIKILSWIVATILVYLNSHLVLDFATKFIQDSESLLLKIVLVLFIVFFAVLILFITAYPLFRKRDQSKDADFHGALIELDLSQDLPVNRIAIAVDFSVADAKLIKTAIQHAHQATEFIFIHIVESATAKYLADASDDEETRKDQMRLDIYAQALEKKGYKAVACLGYHHRVKEIVRLVGASNAQLLVMGAHQHQGWRDYVFGETIESVRHKVDIPVLIVNQS
jgi:manganese transport protein